MVYPSHEDYERRERDERQRVRATLARAEDARSYYEQTGVCGRRVEGSDRTGGVCPICEHTDFVHPGFPNPGLDRCAICAVLAATSALDEVVVYLRQRGSST